MDTGNNEDYTDSSNFAPIDLHWCYDRPLGTNDPGSVDRAQVDWSRNP